MPRQQQNYASTAQRVFAEAMAASLPPAGLEAYKLDRLLELRAVIDSLRAERHHDPLIDAHGILARSHD
jgi:hypothetical protein